MKTLDAIQALKSLIVTDDNLFAHDTGECPSVGDDIKDCPLCLLRAISDDVTNLCALRDAVLNMPDVSAHLKAIGADGNAMELTAAIAAIRNH